MFKFIVQSVTSRLAVDWREFTLQICAAMPGQAAQECDCSALSDCHRVLFAQLYDRWPAAGNLILLGDKEGESDWRVMGRPRSSQGRNAACANGHANAIRRLGAQLEANELICPRLWAEPDGNWAHQAIFNVSFHRFAVIRTMLFACSQVSGKSHSSVSRTFRAKGLLCL